MMKLKIITAILLWASLSSSFAQTTTITNIKTWDETNLSKSPHLKIGVSFNIINPVVLENNNISLYIHWHKPGRHLPGRSLKFKPDNTYRITITLNPQEFKKWTSTLSDGSTYLIYLSTQNRGGKNSGTEKICFHGYEWSQKNCW